MNTVHVEQAWKKSTESTVVYLCACPLVQSLKKRLVHGDASQRMA